MPPCLESSMAQSKRDEVSNELAESDSDSGDSLFITQKPVSEAVRSGRRRNDDVLSNLTPPEDVIESGTSSRTLKKDRRKKCELPKYTFPFLPKGRKRRRGALLPVWNKTLNNFAMGGFFKCVRELQEGYQREDDVDCPLPTVDMEGEYIPQLPEAEEMFEDEDIRVVEKKCFVKPSKRISRQTWCTQLTQQRRWNVNAGQETSPGAQNKISNEIPAEASISRAAPLSPPSAVKNLSGDATVMRQEKGDVPDSKQKKNKRIKSASEHFRQEVDGNLESGERMEDSTFSVSCNLENIGKKKEKKRKRRDEDAEQSQSSAAVECLNDDAEIRMNKKQRKKEETVIVEEECEEKEASHKTSDFPPMSAEQFEKSGNGLENTAASGTLEIGYVKRKKHKKRQQSSSMDVSQDREEDVGVSLSNDARTLKESTGTPLKKKRHDECLDPLQSSIATDPLNDDSEMQTERKKEEECEEKEASNKTSDFPPMSAEQLEPSGNGLENTAASGTLERGYVKRKKHKKKLLSSSMYVSQDGEEDVGVSLSNDARTLKESTGTSLKKKKKKRHDEGLDPLQSSTATDPLNDDAEIQTKKKKRIGNSI